MAEEHQRYQEAHGLCANNCGFFGSPATQNLCSKCYRDFRLKEENAASAKIAVEKSLNCPSSSSSANPAVGSAADGAVPSVVSAAVPEEVVSAARRCLACKRKVGLTGFKCRCGAMFCGAHRYPEAHACGFDFKKSGREEIARANPVVKADKVGRI